MKLKLKLNNRCRLAHSLSMWLNTRSFCMHQWKINLSQFLRNKLTRLSCTLATVLICVTSVMISCCGMSVSSVDRLVMSITASLELSALISWSEHTVPSNSRPSALGCSVRQLGSDLNVEQNR